MEVIPGFFVTTKFVEGAAEPVVDIGLGLQWVIGFAK